MSTAMCDETLADNTTKSTRFTSRNQDPYKDLYVNQQIEVVIISERYASTLNTMNVLRKIIKIQDHGVARTVAACFAAHTTSLLVGFSQGYSAILIPQLMDNSDTMAIDNVQASWVASLGVISNPIGAVIAGFLSEYLGRKKTVQYCSIPFIIGWLTIALAVDIETLYVGRFITGLSVGVMTTTFTYIAEITTADQRGILSAFGPVMTSFGVLLIYTLGYYLQWKIVALISVAVSFTTIITMTLVPESPSWLISKKKKDEALKSLIWLRGNDMIALKDLEELILNKDADKINQDASFRENSHQKEITNVPTTISSKFLNLVKLNYKYDLQKHEQRNYNVTESYKELTCDKLGNKNCTNLNGPYIISNNHLNHTRPKLSKTKSLFNIISSPKTYKPFCILLIFFLFQEFSGIYIILFYSVSFLKSMNTNLNDYISTIIIGVLRFITSIIGAILIRRYPRKLLAMTSGLGMAGFLIICGIYLKYYEIHIDEEKVLPMLPLFCILSSVCMSMIGFLQLPYVMNSELFPLRIRGIMSGLVLSLANVFIFCSVKIYPDLIDSLNLSGTILLFGLTSFFGAIYCVLFLPETQNKTLTEIEASFENKKRFNDIERYLNNSKY